MITLLVGTSLIAGTLCGWFGHRAKLRIDLWGRNSYSCDQIFQEAEGLILFEDDWQRPSEEGVSLAPFSAQHLSPGSAILK